MEVLEQVGNFADEMQDRKFRLTTISGTESEASATLELTYRAAIERQLETRTGSGEKGWRSDQQTKKVLDFLFHHKFHVILKSCGALRVHFREPDHWSEGERKFLSVELGNQLFHFAKFVVEILQKQKLIPQDFEYKRYATAFSKQPEDDILEKFEDVFAGIHMDCNEQAIQSLNETSNSLSNWVKVAVFPFRPLRRTKLVKSYWGNSRRQASIGKALMSWYYWLIEHSLPESDKKVREVLNGRLKAAYADLDEIESQHDAFFTINTHMASEWGISMSFLAIGIALFFAIPLTAWFALPGGVLILMALTRLVYPGSRYARLMADDADALLEVFRWDHSIEEYMTASIQLETATEAKTVREPVDDTSATPTGP